MSELEQWIIKARQVEIHKAGNAQGLIDWYNNGADGQIQWGEHGDFDACVAIAGKYLDNPEGFCQNRHMDATGEPAGKAPGEVSKADKADEPDYEKVISSRKGEPDDQDLYNKIKGEAQEKFDVYPSAVANGWVVQEYKRRGGTYSVSKSESLTPPKGVQEAAQQALEWMKDGKAGDGFTSVGRKRASDLANGHAVSMDTLKRMKAYFDRHQADKDSPHWDEPSPGKVAWYAWGGDAGYSWAKSAVGHDVEKAAVQTLYVHSVVRPQDGVRGTIENHVGALSYTGAGYGLASEIKAKLQFLGLDSSDAAVWDKLCSGYSDGVLYANTVQ